MLKEGEFRVGAMMVFVLTTRRGGGLLFESVFLNYYFGVVILLKLFPNGIIAAAVSKSLDTN